MTAPPSRNQRLGIAIVVGALCGLVSWNIARSLPDHAYQDFAFVWFAARDFLAGQNPYQSVTSLTGRPMFFFPLTTALGVIPFVFLRLDLAGPIFVALSTAALAFVVTKAAWWPLLMFLSGSMVVSIVAANFATVLPLGFFVPWLGWLGVFKPNIGIAMLAYRPSWKNLLVMIALAGLSLVVRPTWPGEWLRAAMNSPYHFAPWRTAGGVLLVVALARWRLPEARMLLTMALLPSSPIAYEALPLFVIPRTRREMLVLAITTNVVVALTASTSFQGDPDAYLAVAQPAMVWLAYVPALVMVLSRQNIGPAPEWLERIAARPPKWIQGKRGELATISYLTRE